MAAALAAAGDRSSDGVWTDLGDAQEVSLLASNRQVMPERYHVFQIDDQAAWAIGLEDETAAAILRDLYRPLYLIETPILVTGLVTAEVIKYASNAFLATKISFVNEVANLCERVGADVEVVARGMGLDNRVGPKFLHPGPGFGGSCFPKDVKAVVRTAAEHGYDFRILKAVEDVNETQKRLLFDLVVQLTGGGPGTGRR